MNTINESKDSTIRERLESLFDVVLDDFLKRGRLNKAFTPVIKNVSKMMKPLLDNVPESELQKGIEELRDKMIPWVLTGDKPNENTLMVQADNQEN